MGRHGGGAFSGKDCTKVDRSAATRRAGLRKTWLRRSWPSLRIQITYAIGMAARIGHGRYVRNEPCCRRDDSQAVQQVFDLRPVPSSMRSTCAGPSTRKTAAYGHFGRELPEFTWERADRVEELKAACGFRETRLGLLDIPTQSLDSAYTCCAR